MSRQLYEEVAIDPRWAKLKAEGKLEDPELVLDIETVIDVECLPPPPKDPAKPEFPGPAHHRVVTIGAAWILGGAVMKFGTIKGSSEEQVLRAFVDIFAERSLRIIGWNTRGFDLPVIAHRCLRYGIPWPWYYCEVRGRSPRYRYATDCHLDLMDYLSDHGSSRKQTLDSAARLMGLPGKLGASGGDVAELYAAGKREEIDRYCLQDVAQTTALHFRVALLRGIISLGTYRTSMDTWLACLKSTPGPDELYAKIAAPDRVMLPEQLVRPGPSRPRAGRSLP